MAYPFAPAIKFSAFLERVCRDFGCTKKTRPIRHVITGERVELTHVTRVDAGGKEWHAFFEMHDWDQLAPTVIRSNCRALGIPPDEFGFTLDTSS